MENVSINPSHASSLNQAKGYFTTHGDAVIENIGNSEHHIALIKAIRNYTGLGLKEAKDMADSFRGELRDAAHATAERQAKAAQAAQERVAKAERIRDIFNAIRQLQNEVDDTTDSTLYYDLGDAKAVLMRYGASVENRSDCYVSPLNRRSESFDEAWDNFGR